MVVLGKVLATTCWAVLVCAGLAFAWRYESTAGAPAKAPSDWPSGTTLKLHPSRPAVIMFAHPECPCTKASLEQLAEIAASHPDTASIQVVIVQPEGLKGTLNEFSIAKQALNIPNAQVIQDHEGRQAKLFGAKTSGQVLVYSAAGMKLFSGGVTSSRGHYGPSGGSDAISSILQKEVPKTASTPVYGCSLMGAGN
jgi:hypothetical protein